MSVVGVVSRLRAGRTIQGSIPSSPKRQDRRWGSHGFLFQCISGALARGLKLPGMKLAAHFHLVSEVKSE